MGIKISDSAVQKHLQKLQQRYADNNARSVEIGVTDASIAPYATYVEYGWVQRVTPKQQWWFRNQRIDHPPKAGDALVNPPRPFLRGTLKAEGAKWRETMRKALHKTGSPRQALSIVGMQAVQDVQETIRNGGTRKEKFPERAPLTMELYAASSAGKSKTGKNRSSKANASTTKPLVLSGALLHSIGFEVK